MGFYYYFGIFLYSVCVFITLTNSAGTSSNNDSQAQFPFATICKGIVKCKLAPNKEKNIETEKVLQFGKKLKYNGLVEYASQNSNNEYVKLQAVLEFVYIHFKKQETQFKSCFNKCTKICNNIVNVLWVSYCTSEIIFFKKKLLGNILNQIVNKYTSFGDRFNYKDMFDNIMADFENVVNPSTSKHLFSNITCL
ncbi:uncharacterized protein LOC126902756 isoform X1 [Daktulosphaira vitifoliae]|uniref:uncharacterized protein LOC126902756 isoform X1 n=1 Tax=Daktulosphaira vitifoliae TaxID=58002 RepID=UPI0021A98072|nr:uncharacterized protein LOC126902756 isoform X1 [Daktulosphaira vitifoliae]